MEKKGHIISASADQLRAMNDRGESRTDWRRVDALPQAEVERLAEADDGLLADGWDSTVEIGIPERKQAVQIRLDADVVRWFKERGPGYQTRINIVLRSFMQARRQAERLAKPK